MRGATERRCYRHACHCCCGRWFTVLPRRRKSVRLTTCARFCLPGTSVVPDLPRSTKATGRSLYYGSTAKHARAWRTKVSLPNAPDGAPARSREEKPGPIPTPLPVAGARSMCPSPFSGCCCRRPGCPWSPPRRPASRGAPAAARDSCPSGSAERMIPCGERRRVWFADRMRIPPAVWRCRPCGGFAECGRWAEGGGRARSCTYQLSRMPHGFKRVRQA